MPLLAGFATSLSLIVANGAQNAFVLRQGLRREHVLPVVLTCALSDALLISSGILGLGALLTRSQVALDLAKFGRCRLPLHVRRSGRETSLATRLDQPGRSRARRAAQRRTDLPGLHVPQPARLPGHRRTARLTRQPTRHRRPLALRPRSRHRQLHLVLLPGLLLPQTLRPLRPPPRLANPRLHHRHPHGHPRHLDAPTLISTGRKSCWLPGALPDTL